MAGFRSLDETIEIGRGFGVGQRESAGLLEVGQVFKKALNHGGDGGVALGAPDADVAIDLVVDGDGDVAHEWLPGDGVEWVLGSPGLLCAGGK